LSTTLAGYASDHFGTAWAFLILAGLAAIGLLTVLAFMPETGDVQDGGNESRPQALF
jgi:predicted MFS family arabinose efflux permease